MKRLMVSWVCAFAIVGFTPLFVQAQGTSYVSSLDQIPTGSSSIGSDSWLAAPFRTGGNVGGYLLNSVQLGMADATGSPSSFTAMLYSATGVVGVYPGISLETLEGSLSPVTGGVFTYTPSASVTLSPTTSYFIVLAAGTPVAAGAYEWSVTSTFSPILVGGWQGDNYFPHSSDSLNWNYISGTYPIFAINATPIPEPSVLSLLGLGGLAFLSHRRKAKRV